MSLTQGRSGVLLLEDGREFAGRLVGSARAAGELVFTTNMTGYQEVLTDPSFAGQIVVMTAPMMGNYGVTIDDSQSHRAWAAGFVVRELRSTSHNWRAGGSLPEYLAEQGIAALEGIDTRAVTRHIRSLGAMRAMILEAEADRDEARRRLEAEPSMLGRDLATEVSTGEPYVVEPQGDALRGRPAGDVVCLDLGVKRRSLELIAREGFRVVVVPGTTPATEILERDPVGVFVSNGPGDPGAVPGVAGAIVEIAEAGIPVFGICLGCQLIARAFGGDTYKLPYGHRGGNHPVRNLETGAIEITSQNHGFAVRGDGSTVEGASTLRVTHVNLNDGTIEGLRDNERPIFAVQYHPEAAPGPHDSRYLFERFVEAIDATATMTTG